MKISSAEILAARAGDPEARAALMRKVEGIVEGMLLVRRRATCCRRQFDWEGLSQDVLVQVLRELTRFRGEDGGCFVRWLEQIVRTRHLNALRKPGGPSSKLASALSLDVVLLHLDISDSACGPLEAASQVEQHAILDRAIGELPIRSRQLIRLRLCAELPFRVIAEQLGLASAKAAESLFWRVRKHLKVILLRGRTHEGRGRMESE